MITDYIYQNTVDYGKNVKKKTDRKKIGQFFTPPSVANFMAGLINVKKSDICLLDAGAGTGILTGAACQQVLENKNIKTVHVDLYESDPNILPFLKENMEYIRQAFRERHKSFSYEILKENFILDNQDYWNDSVGKKAFKKYDVIISNPPYKKINKSAEESVAMTSIVHGQPNIYFLFMALSAKLLNEGGQMIFITPRSFTSGAYFKKFREYFLQEVSISHLHLFHSREDIFDSDKVLQESVILKADKTDESTDKIMVSSSDNMDIGQNFMHEVDYPTVVEAETAQKFIMIPTNNQELHVMNTVKEWSHDLPSLGFKLKTGPVVDFRATEFLRNVAEPNAVPLLWANHFLNNKVVFPAVRENIKKPQYIMDEERSEKLLLENRNYLIIKRFTSKEEHRRVQCAIYLSETYPYDMLGVENHLNYVKKLNGEMNNEELYGLYALFNSSYIDTYYRILNGSTQVNATEMNSVPLPSLPNIKRIGNRIIERGNLSTEYCDQVIQDICHYTFEEKEVV